MATSESNHRDDVPEAPAFVTTHWSVVLAAGRSDPTRAQAALEHLCRLFEVLKPSLTGSRETQPYAALASRLDMSEGAVKVAVHRLRERFRKRLQAEVAHTVGSPADVEDELRHLFRVLARTR